MRTTELKNFPVGSGIIGYHNHKDGIFKEVHTFTFDHDVDVSKQALASLAGFDPNTHHGYTVLVPALEPHKAIVHLFTD